jgi:cyclohexyl-isocyanide hydratase
MGARIRIGFLLFPRLTQLDLTGPFEVFARLPGAEVHLAWKTREPVKSDVGLSILPTATLEDCPDLDLLCVPGGPGMTPLLDDDEVLAFVARQGAAARYVTSVCTGALVLGAAGLLRGYRATTHWASLPLLAPLGATPVQTRVCVDRNRMTGGGVSAGIDFGLAAAAELAGEAAAQRIQLFMEYDPAPPFRAGSPETAPPEVLGSVRDAFSDVLAEREAAVNRAVSRLAGGE